MTSDGKGAAPLAVLPLLFVGLLAGAARGQAPGEGVTQADHPGADAVILSWEQSFTLESDGSVRRRDRRLVKLLNSRPVRRFADPRIDFEAGREKVVIHRAVTHLPDGTVLPVPGYSLNIASPNDVSGWPAFAAWRQRIVSFSGIRPGVVLELDHETVSEPGVFPWLSGEIRLFDRYPVIRRRVDVAVPAGTVVRHVLSGPAAAEFFDFEGEGTRTLTWKFSDLPGDPDEPQAVPWRERGGRLCFSTCPDAETLVARVLERVEGAAKWDAEMTALAEKTAAKEPAPREQAKRISSFLGERFNAIGSARAWRSLRCRPAREVLRANYGHPLESGALLAALLRSLRLEARILLAVDPDIWVEDVPLPAAVTGLVAQVSLEDGEKIHVRPLAGPVRDPGDFGPRLLLGVDEAGTLFRHRVRSRAESTQSRIVVSGKLEMNGSGGVSGRLRVSYSGAFLDPSELTSEDARKKLIEGTARRLLGGAAVESVQLHTLSADDLVATAKVKVGKAVSSHDGRHVVRLGGDPLFLASFPLPLARSERRGAVRLTGGMKESVDLHVVLPKGWSATRVAKPAEIQGDWGLVRESVLVVNGVLRLHRRIDIPGRTIPREAFAGLRAVINGLRSSANRFVEVGP